MLVLSHNAAHERENKAVKIPKFVKYLAVAIILLIIVAFAVNKYESTHSSTPTSQNSAVTGDTSSQLAIDVLNSLSVKPNGSKKGYDRVANFGEAWTDNNNTPSGHNGCDTRNDILARDFQTKTFKAGTRDCTVITGTYTEPYTGKTVTWNKADASQIQIDHMVPLGLIYAKGGMTLLTADQRVDIANDPLNLIAADGKSNMAKSDKDAAEWLPSNKAFQCEYVARQISVEAKYKLPVDPAEKTAMTNVLKTCPEQHVYTETTPGVALHK